MSLFIAHVHCLYLLYAYCLCQCKCLRQSPILYYIYYVYVCQRVYLYCAAELREPAGQDVGRVAVQVDHKVAGVRVGEVALPVVELAVGVEDEGALRRKVGFIRTVREPWGKMN